MIHDKIRLNLITYIVIPLQYYQLNIVQIYIMWEQHKLDNHYADNGSNHKAVLWWQCVSKHIRCQNKQYVFFKNTQYFFCINFMQYHIRSQNISAHARPNNCKMRKQQSNIAYIHSIYVRLDQLCYGYMDHYMALCYKNRKVAIYSK